FSPPSSPSTVASSSPPSAVDRVIKARSDAPPSETIGLDVWEKLVNSPIGVVARLVGRESMWSGRTAHYLLCRQLRVHKKEIYYIIDEAIRFSLLEFGEITGLNTCPLPTESFEPDQYKEFWEELKVPLGMGPKLDELKA
ncbi:unnamed protein product, partial [Brassica oleracea]